MCFEFCNQHVQPGDISTRWEAECGVQDVFGRRPRRYPLVW
jgi:hypothetical protein